MKRPIRKLTRLQQDLADYTRDKACNVIKDVLQAFEIAGAPRAQAADCVGVVFLRLAAALAAQRNMSKKMWVDTCGRLFSDAIKAYKENP